MTVTSKKNLHVITTDIEITAEIVIHVDIQGEFGYIYKRYSVMLSIGKSVCIFLPNKTDRLIVSGLQKEMKIIVEETIHQVVVTKNDTKFVRQAIEVIVVVEMKAAIKIGQLEETDGDMMTDLQAIAAVIMMIPTMISIALLIHRHPDACLLLSIPNYPWNL